MPALTALLVDVVHQYLTLAEIDGAQPTRVLGVIHVHPHPAVVVVTGWIREDPRNDVVEPPASQPTVDEYAVGVADDDDLVAVGMQGDQERLHPGDRGYPDDGVLDLPGVDAVLVQEFQDPAHVRDPAA